MYGRLREFRALLFVCAVGLTMLAAWRGTPVKSAVGCNVPRFDGDSATFGVGTGPRSLAAADFNLDGRNDLAVANYGSGQGSSNGQISILLNNGSGGFSAAGNISAGINPRSIVTADFNKDTKPDLALAVTKSGLPSPLKPVAGDWNGDGIDTIGIYRNGVIFLSNSNATGFADIVFVLGNSGDFPIAGNWNGSP